MPAITAVADIETGLVEEARSIYQDISPCGGNSTFRECFTREDGKLFFWFNTADRSTRVLSASLR